MYDSRPSDSILRIKNKIIPNTEENSRLSGSRMQDDSMVEQAFQQSQENVGSGAEQDTEEDW